MTDKLTLVKWEAIRMKDEHTRAYFNTDLKNEFGRAYELGLIHALDYIIVQLELQIGDKTN